MQLTILVCYYSYCTRFDGGKLLILFVDEKRKWPIFSITIKASTLGYLMTSPLCPGDNATQRQHHQLLSKLITDGFRGGCGMSNPTSSFPWKIIILTYKIILAI